MKSPRNNKTKKSIGLRGGKYNAFKDEEDYIDDNNNNYNNRNVEKYRNKMDNHNQDFGNFANFDDFSNNDTTPSRRHNHHKETAMTNEREKRMKGRSSHKSKSISPTKHRHTHHNYHSSHHKKPPISYDSEAASDSKWSKLQANEQNNVYSSSMSVSSNTMNRNNSTTRSSSSVPKIRTPTHTSLGRSLSNSRASNNAARAVSANTNTSSSSRRRRERSITPRSNQYQHNPNESSNHSNTSPSSSTISKFKTRTRSISPAAPQSSFSTSNYDTGNSNNYKRRGQNEITPTKQNHSNKHQQHNSSRSKMRQYNTNTSSRSRQQSQQQQQQKDQTETKEEKRLRKYYASKSFTFQNPHSLLSYKTIDYSTRRAFDPIPIPTISDLESIVTTSNSLSTSGTRKQMDAMTIQNKMKKLSPSPQYIELMNQMNQMDRIRQLCWSPSISNEADPFNGWEDDDDDDDDTNDIPPHNQTTTTTTTTTNQERSKKHKIRLQQKRKKLAASNSKYRYTQMNIQSYVQSTLLDHSITPSLSNIKRHRLPMRSDVGFPKATEEEIMLKQKEVAVEAQLEEVSPRLIVLLRSDDLGGGDNNGDVEKVMDARVLDKLEYKLPGMPYAGKELTMIKNMQTESVVLKENTNTSKTTRKKKKKVKPDPSSVFAPPIDSMISSSEIWRPRPFLDRPAGMSYAMAIPVDIRFATGNIEPLVCTLALYCLPKSNNGKRHHPLKGKISEDFIFPAGEWGELLQEKAGEILARQFGVEKDYNSAKHQKRLRKALFSFLPTDLPKAIDESGGNDDNDGIDSLYLVMNVHKVTHKDAGLAYMNSNTASRNLMPGKGTIGGMLFGGSGNSYSSSSHSSRQGTINARDRATNAFDAFGSQFLTPFCFGLIPLFPNDPESHLRKSEAYEWPNGISQSMLMFAHPMKAESQEAFVDRLTVLAERTSKHAHIIDEMNVSLSNSDSQSFDDDSNIIAITSEDSFNSPNKVPKRKRPKFKFRRRKTTKTALTTMEEIFQSDTKLIDGSAIFYTSNVGADFSQTLLQHPSFLENEKAREASFPQMLVDVSGDCAIMIHPDLSSSARKKRSNLIRLPPSSRSSGYSDSCEIREVLYLPFQTDLKFDTAPCLSPRTSLNLLYVYPRLIQKVSNSETAAIDRHCCFSVRIRLVQQKLIKESGAITPTYVPTESIYNTSLGGESLLQAVYTKIPLGCTGKSSKADVNVGIALQDEIKVRLPMVLDGSHFLNFTLYSIKLNDDSKDSGGLIQNIVGDTFIPLSSSITKESGFGKKVTTIIPNGLHRIKIGDFQVQVVSRLISTIHVSDPSVAAVVRDFDVDSYSESLENSSLMTKMLSKASEQSPYSHFYTLACIHLRTLLNSGTIVFDLKSRKVVPSLESMTKLECLRSFMTLIQRAKKKFLNLEDMPGMKMFLKTFLDLFDEYSFNDNAQRQISALPVNSNSNSNLSLVSDHDSENFDVDDIDHHDQYEAEDQSMKYKLNNYAVDLKTLNERYADNAVPFSRKAYGVSKMDIMKAEAELFESGQTTLNELFDDDETVVTASTWHSNPLTTPSTNSISYSRPSTAQSIFKASLSPDSNELDTETVTDTGQQFDFSSPFERARSMANKVNRLAQIFTAPCIAPDLNDGAMNTPDRQKLIRMKRTRKQPQVRPGSLIDEFYKSSPKQKPTSTALYSHGSDTEDDVEYDHSRFGLYPNSPQNVLIRGLQVVPNEITFSLSDEEPLVDKTSYLYEIILTMWVQTSRYSTINDKNSSPPDNVLFFRQMDFLLPLCLKSLALRCLPKKKTQQIVPSILLDVNHMLIIEPLMNVIATGLVNQAINTDIGNIDDSIRQAVAQSDSILDFIIGLMGIIHPAQVSWVISKYLHSLRSCETNQNNPTETFMPKIRANRQLRLRAVERLAVIPQFIAINFPYKFHTYKWEGSNGKCSWTNQVVHDSKIDGYDTLSGLFHGRIRVPEANWLSQQLLDECLSICYQCCEVLVNGTVSQVKVNATSQKKSAMRQKVSVSKKDMAHYHAIGYQSITIVYELILRMHSCDARYQSEGASFRIAGMFVSPVIEKALETTQLLSKMHPDHNIRTIWLVCLLYVLQEAPETALRQQMHSMCTKTVSELFVLNNHEIASELITFACHKKSNIKEGRISRFIRLLKLCTVTFQCFTLNKYRESISPWLVQESFNTISASSILLVDECYEIMSHKPYERKKMVEHTLDLLLHIISAPLSSVTHLRALGAASHVLEKVGTTAFIEAVDDDLQHWGRMIFSLMNSISLSVRSMAVDLSVSLFGSLFQEGGNIDEVSQVFLTILPEVVAREIALYSANNLVKSATCVEKSLWPLRRALADIEEADPIDDDRVDAQLTPFLSHFCRACQAIIDGVIIELRLQGNDCEVIGTKLQIISGDLRNTGGKVLPLSWMFDADEESLFEAASFFAPETCPLQRVRWLLTLKRLHAYKGQWVEAGETLMLCAKTVAEAIPHIRSVWRPSHFLLWNDVTVAPWLATVGKGTSKGIMNDAIMEFANEFLEPSFLRDLVSSSSDDYIDQGLASPNIPVICKILSIVSKGAIQMYDKENGMDPIVFARLEELLKIVMGFVEEHAISAGGAGSGRRSSRYNRAQLVEEIAMLRKACATVNELVTRTAERMLLLAEQNSTPSSFGFNYFQSKSNKMEIFFVRMQLIGKKCNRFLESTTIPTFLDWNVPSIYRVPSDYVWKVMSGERVKSAKNRIKNNSQLQDFIEREVCNAFAEPFISFLRQNTSTDGLKLCTEMPDNREIEKNGNKLLYLVVSPVRIIRSSKEHQTKKFHSSMPAESTEEITVAKYFPCALSRQTIVITRIVNEGAMQTPKLS